MLQHVGEVLGIDQVVDADDLDIVETLRGAKNHAPDTTKTVNADANSHMNFSSEMK